MSFVGKLKIRFFEQNELLNSKKTRNCSLIIFTRPEMRVGKEDWSALKVFAEWTMVHSKDQPKTPAFAPC